MSLLDFKSSGRAKTPAVGSTPTRFRHFFLMELRREPVSVLCYYTVSRGSDKFQSYDCSGRAEEDIMKFSRLFDVTHPDIKAWQKGFEPRLSPLISIVKNLKDINPEWLIIGDGPEYRLEVK